MTTIPVKYTVDGEEAVLRAARDIEGANVRAFGQIETRSRAAGKSMFSLSADVQLVERNLATLARRTDQFFGVVVTGLVARGARGLIDMTDAYAALNGQIKTVTDSEEALVRVRAEVLAIARRTRTELGSTGETYGRLSRATESLYYSEEKRLRLTELINKAGKIGQTTLNEQVNGIRQLTQALGSGELRGEELRSVMENTPVLAQAIAEGLGVSIGALRDLAEQGDLTSAKVSEAILKMGDDIDEQFTKVPQKVGEAFGVLNTNLTAYIGAADQAYGVSQKLGGVIGWAADHVDVLATAAVGAGAALALVMSGRVLASFGRGIAETVKAAKAQAALTAATVAETQASLAAAQARHRQVTTMVAMGAASTATKGELTKLQIATLELTAAQKAHAAATAAQIGVWRGLGTSVLGVFGGIPGLVTTAALAVGTFGAAMLASSEDVDTSADRLDRYLDTIGKVRAEIGLLYGDQKTRARDAATADQTAAAAAVEAARSKLLDASRSALGRTLANSDGPRLTSELVAFNELLAAFEEGTVDLDTFRRKLEDLSAAGSPLEGMYSQIAASLNDLAAALDTAAEKAEALKTLRQEGPPLNLRDNPLTGTVLAGYLGGESEAKTGLIDKHLEKENEMAAAMERSVQIQRLRLEGRADEADLMEYMATVEKSIGHEIYKNKATLEALWKESRDNLKEQQAQDKLAATTTGLESDIRALQLRKEGRIDEAEIAEEIAAIEKAIGRELGDQRQAVVDLIADKRRLTAEVKKAEKADKQRESLEDAVALAGEELEILRARLAGNQDLADELALQLALQKQYGDLTDEEREKLAVRKREEAAITKAITERTRELEAAKDALRETSQFIYDSLTDRGDSFADVLKNAVYKGMADGLAPFMQGINIPATISGLFSQGVAGLFGGSDGGAGILSQLLGGQGLLGGVNKLGGLIGFDPNPANTLPGFYDKMPQLSDVLGVAGIGGFGGGLIADLLGLKNQRTSLLSGGGAGLGYILGGPVGGLLGGAAGVLTSALFGNAADKAGTTLRVDGNGAVGLGGNRTYGDGDLSVATAVGNEVSRSLLSIADQLGGRLSSGFLVGEVGYRNDKFFFDPTANASEKGFGRTSKDGDTQTFATAEEAATAAIISALRSGAVGNLPAEVANRLKNVTADTLDDVLSDLEVFGSLRDEITKGLADVEAPLTAALDELASAYQQSVDVYRRMGGDITEVNEWFLGQQQRLIDEYKTQGSALLTGFLDDLKSGEFSGLTDGQRYASTRADFLDLQRQVAAGVDVEDQALVDASNAFLQASLAVNAMTDQFFNDRSLVEAAIGQELANFAGRIEEAVTNADLIQPLDSIAESAAETNNLLETMIGSIADLKVAVQQLGGTVGGGNRTIGGNFKFA